MKYIFSVALFSVLMMAAPQPSLADDTTQLLQEAIGLLNAGDYAEAREVVAIALDQIDHHMLDTTAAIFPVQIGAFTRGEVSSQKTMGFEMTECTYSNDREQNVQVQLMGGGSLFDSIADLGSNMQGGRKVRIAGRSGSSMESDGEATVTLKLKNGKSLIFTSRDLDIDAVTGIVEQFPIEEIDKSGS